MADTKTPDTQMNQNKANDQMQRQGSEAGSNQTMRHENAKREVGDRSHEKSAIGGAERSQTGEPGRARNELDQNSSSGSERNSAETTGSR